jgi:hypothetical protein
VKTDGFFLSLTQPEIPNVLRRTKFQYI